jgi:hypothetical protein
MASHNVHAEAKGATFRIGVLPRSEGKLLLAGPSNAGLEEAGRWTGYSLLNITYTLLSVTENFDSIVYGHALMMLDDDVSRRFYEAAVKLSVDEEKIAKSERRKRKSRAATADVQSVATRLRSAGDRYV